MSDVGWWSQNEEGHSFAEADSGEEMLWGDGPADAIDNAIDQIKIEFVRDHGRLPTGAELMAGLTFSTRRALDHLPTSTVGVPRLTDDERENFYALSWNEDETSRSIVYGVVHGLEKDSRPDTAAREAADREAALREGFGTEGEPLS